VKIHLDFLISNLSFNLSIAGLFFLDEVSKTQVIIRFNFDLDVILAYQYLDLG
jgi:hypothetical protein